jgi:SAM-dependent methyltransferase
MTRAFYQLQRRYFQVPDEAHFRFQTSGSGIGESEAALLSQVVAPNQGQTLEIGCGEGANLFHLAKRFCPAQLAGVDFSSAKVMAARRHLPEVVQLFCADATKLPCPDRSYDVVLMRDILHHLPLGQGRDQALGEAYRVLKPGGRLYLIEPNGRCPLVLLQAGLIPAERGALSSTRAALRRALVGAGFFIEEETRAQPLPLSRILFHPHFGLPMRWAKGALQKLCTRTEAAVGRLMPESLWLYLCYVARREA